jgi:hypothetical protein
MIFIDLYIRTERAINALFARDAKLIELGASEWAIAHRLAVYLEQEIPGWNVDCEYNVQGQEGDVKTNAQTVGSTERTRPDIILHHRGLTSLNHNLLLVELKLNEIADDQKVMEFTLPPVGKRKFQYQYGLALAFLPQLQPRWYSEGKPCNDIRKL